MAGAFTGSAQLDGRDLLSSVPSHLDKPLGVLYAHAYGDAAGGVLEFEFRGPPPHDAVEEAMTLSGGGRQWDLSPGQITDDAELTVCLFDGLFAPPVTGTAQEKLERVAENFVAWAHSDPFDMGQTTANALYIRDFPLPAGKPYAPMCTAAAARRNSNSLSNGALMRCLPHAVYAYVHKWPLDRDLVRAEVALTHPNPRAAQLVLCYLDIVLALMHDDSGTTTDYLAILEQYQVQIPQLAMFVDSLSAGKVPLAAWAPGESGFDLRSFSVAMYALHAHDNLYDGMRYAISQGGDVDTNAAIAGGLLGAKFGLSKGLRVEHVRALITSRGIAHKSRGWRARDRSAYNPRVYLDTLCGTQ